MVGTGRTGFTLYEVMVVLAIMGIAAAIVGPRLEEMVAFARVRGAANRVAADLAFTRQLAARSGHRARLVIERAADCAAPPGGAAGHRYRVVQAGPDSVALRTDLRLDGRRLCLATNVSDHVTFTSHGVLLGFNNRTMVVTQQGVGAVADTLTLSAVGRVRRRF